MNTTVYYHAPPTNGMTLRFDCHTLKIDDILECTKKEIVKENARRREEAFAPLVFETMFNNRNKIIITDDLGNVFQSEDVYTYKRALHIYEMDFDFESYCRIFRAGCVSKKNYLGEYEYIYMYPHIFPFDDVEFLFDRLHLKELNKRINNAKGNITKIMNAKQPDFDSRLISQQVHEFLVGDTKRARTEEEELEQSGICLIT